jgi:cobyrinic acid a,c-diamide synthase
MAGVIANRVGSAGHANMVASALRDIPLLATLPKQKRALPERHLGLVLPNEVSGIDALLDELADQLSFADAAWHSLPPVEFTVPEPAPPAKRLLAGRTIAVARDAAFMFLYPANLQVLESLGATLRYFSPLADEALPQDTDAIFLPGGYPELHGATLAAASNWQAGIRAAHSRGIPIYAECGGMMALAEQLTGKDGTTWPMAGLLPGRVAMQERLAGLGPQAMPTPQGELRGHTFHYSRLESPLVPVAHTMKPSTGAEGEAIYRAGSLRASYFHAYFPSNPAAAAALFLPEAA